MAIPPASGVAAGLHKVTAPALKVMVPVGVPENCGPTVPVRVTPVSLP